MPAHFWSSDGLVAIKVAATEADEFYAITAARLNRDQLPIPAQQPGSFFLMTSVWTQLTRPAVAGLLGSLAESVRTIYVPPIKGRLPVFDAPAGQAIYLGTIHIYPRDGSLSKNDPPKNIRVGVTSTPEEMAAAARYLAKYYPKVRVQLRMGVVQMLPTTEYGD